MKLFPSVRCAEAQHRLGVARLFVEEEAGKVTRLKESVFSGAGRKSVPQRAAPQRSSPVSKSGSAEKGFGSLAAAFGEAKAPPKRQAPPTSQPKAKPSGGSMQFLSAEEAWLLSNLGPEPGRNREDLIRRVCLGLLGTPLTKLEWDPAVVLAGENLFERASQTCGTVAKILSVAERVGRLLGASESGYEESLSDANEHFTSLLAPGWLLAGSLSRRLIHFQGLETRLTRMLGAPPAKDLDKLDRYHERASAIWAEQTSCECRQCPDAITSEEIYEKDFDLRLQIFAPEIRARMK